MYQGKKALLLSIAISTVLLSVQAEARLKCWKNNEGITECGNVIPPEYAQKASKEISKSGIVVDKTTRAKTREELDAEKAERDKQAAIEAEEKRKAEKQAAEDRVLLDTFANEDDIILTRDGKLTNIDSDITLIESRIGSLQKNLDQMISQAADDERAGKPPSEKITSDIANVRRQIAQNNAFIDKKRAEQDTIRADYEELLKRFRELKGLNN